MIWCALRAETNQTQAVKFNLEFQQDKHCGGCACSTFPELKIFLEPSDWSGTKSSTMPHYILANEREIAYKKVKIDSDFLEPMKIYSQSKCQQW